MRTFHTIWAVLGVLACAAQQQVKITDPEAIRLDPQLGRNKAFQTALSAYGISSEQGEDAVRLSDPALWPPGLRNDSARKANAPYIQNYAVFPLCAYMEDTTTIDVLVAPAMKNLQMPEDLRPVADLYLVVPRRAVSPPIGVTLRPPPSRGPRWKDLPPTRILRADELYATYDLADDKEALAAMEKAGMSQPEIDAVVFRSHERNWPDGIDGFQTRQPRLKDFRKFRCYLGAKWDGKVLLIVPADKNKGMPTLMRPFVDIYFVYNATAVQYKDKRRK